MNQSPVAPNRRILVIDDNRAIHEHFVKILCGSDSAELDAEEAAIFGGPAPAEPRAGFELTSAYQGGEGVEKLRDAQDRGQPFALAFVDVRMPPGLDGMETALLLWEVDPELQVVLCTAYSDYSWQEMTARFEKPDRLLVIKKPFDAIEVVQVAHALAEKWRLTQQLRAQLDTLETRVRERTADLLIANDTLRQQAALLDKARDAILVCELSGAVRYWNASAERLYGWSAQEATGRPVAELLHREQTEFTAAMKVLIERGDWIGELRHMTRDGRDLIIEAHWTLVRDERGKPQSVLSINTDITAKKEFESQFLRAQRMDSLGTLAGGIAHDLNNVLAPIVMGAELLEASVQDASAKRLLNIIEVSATRGSEMVKQILKFARGTHGTHQVVAPERLIADLERIASDTFPKSIEIRTDVEAGLPTICGDATQLYQVLLNLCVNARDAMPDGGTLAMTASRADVDSTFCATLPDAKAGPHVVIAVADSGSGIPAALRSKIFDPFFTTKEAGVGTGLGLSTSFNIVKAHGGFIKLESTEGRGTTFKVYLPAAAQCEGAAAPHEDDLPRGDGETILLVDDEASICAITADLLEEFGYRVVTASDGADAISVFSRQQEPIDLVLTDMRMPILDGVATIRALRRLDPDVRIVAMSGLSTMPMENGKFDAPRFLAKPYTAHTLLTALRETLHGEP